MRWNAALEVVVAWVVTLPAAALVAACFYGAAGVFNVQLTDPAQKKSGPAVRIAAAGVTSAAGYVRYLHKQTYRFCPECGSTVDYELAAHATLSASQSAPSPTRRSAPMISGFEGHRFPRLMNVAALPIPGDITRRHHQLSPRNARTRGHFRLEIVRPGESLCFRLGRTSEVADRCNGMGTPRSTGLGSLLCQGCRRYPSQLRARQSGTANVLCAGLRDYSSI